MSPKVLNADTLVPLSVLVVVIGAVFWLSSMFASVQANVIAIKELRESVELTDHSRESYRQQLWQAIREQDKGLAIIQGKLDVIASLVTELIAEDIDNKNK